MAFAKNTEQPATPQPATPQSATTSLPTNGTLITPSRYVDSQQSPVSGDYVTHHLRDRFASAPYSAPEVASPLVNRTARSAIPHDTFYLVTGSGTASASISAEASDIPENTDVNCIWRNKDLDGLEFKPRGKTEMPSFVKSAVSLLADECVSLQPPKVINLLDESINDRCKCNFVFFVISDTKCQRYTFLSS